MKWIKSIISSNRESHPLSGNWRGFYANNHSKSRIEVTLNQKGNRLRGSMIDLDNVHEFALEELMRDEDYPPEEISTLENEIRSQFNAPGHAPVISRVTLPKDSSVYGEINDHLEIKLVKEYIGEPLHEYVVGSESIQIPFPNTPVNYRGQFLADKDRIEGTWEIVAIDPDSGKETIESGSFALNRAEQS